MVWVPPLVEYIILEIREAPGSCVIRMFLICMPFRWIIEGTPYKLASTFRVMKDRSALPLNYVSYRNNSGLSSYAILSSYGATF